MVYCIQYYLPWIHNNDVGWHLYHFIYQMMQFIMINSRAKENRKMDFASRESFFEGVTDVMRYQIKYGALQQLLIFHTLTIIYWRNCISLEFFFAFGKHRSLVKSIKKARKILWKIKTRNSHRWFIFFRFPH